MSLTGSRFSSERHQGPTYFAKSVCHPACSGDIVANPSLKGDCDGHRVFLALRGEIAGADQMAHNAVADPQRQATPQTIGCGLKAREIDLLHNSADDPVMRDFIFDAAEALADLILQNPQAYRPERLECARRVFGDPDDDGGNVAA
jgi:hypothetical protein